jgi:hypothetical protein
LQKTIWINAVTGPPPDSEATLHGFVCGIGGVREVNAQKRESSGNSVSFLGHWHTHPNGPALPSSKDESAMQVLANNLESPCPRSMILIVGGTKPNYDMNVFIVDDLVQTKIAS